MDIGRLQFTEHICILQLDVAQTMYLEYHAQQCGSCDFQKSDKQCQDQHRLVLENKTFKIFTDVQRNPDLVYKETRHAYYKDVAYMLWVQLNCRRHTHFGAIAGGLQSQFLIILMHIQLTNSFMNNRNNCCPLCSFRRLLAHCYHLVKHMVALPKLENNANQLIYASIMICGAILRNQCPYGVQGHAQVTPTESDSSNPGQCVATDLLANTKSI